jgi:hypothetical protein
VAARIDVEWFARVSRDHARREHATSRSGSERQENDRRSSDRAEVLARRAVPTPGSSNARHSALVAQEAPKTTFRRRIGLDRRVAPEHPPRHFNDRWGGS